MLLCQVVQADVEPSKPKSLTMYVLEKSICVGVDAVISPIRQRQKQAVGLEFGVLKRVKRFNASRQERPLVLPRFTADTPPVCMCSKTKSAAGCATDERRHLYMIGYDISFARPD